MITVDARGQACPIPVIMTKKEIDQGAKEITVLVDNPTAVENVTKMGKSQGFAVECAAEGADFKLTLSAAAQRNWASLWRRCSSTLWLKATICPSTFC